MSKLIVHRTEADAGKEGTPLNPLPHNSLRSAWLFDQFTYQQSPIFSMGSRKAGLQPTGFNPSGLEEFGAVQVCRDFEDAAPRRSISSRGALP